MDNPIPNSINNIFDEMSYSELYNFDIWITFIAIVVVLFIAIYYFILNTIKSQKSRWNENKCNPLFMPFASVINSDDPDMSNNYTQNVFADCLNNLNQDINLDVQEPISGMFNIFGSLFAFAGSIVSQIVGFILYLFNLLFELFSKIIQRVKLVLQANSNIMVAIMEFLNTILGIMTTIYYTLVLIVDSIKYSITVLALSFNIGAVLPSFVALILSIIATIISGIAAYFIGWLIWPLWGIFYSFLVISIISIAYFILVMIIHAILSEFGKKTTENMQIPSEESEVITG